MSNTEKESKYLQYLPSLFQRGSGKDPGFTGRFLKAFKKILSGRNDKIPPKGIEEILDTIEDYFDPGKTPPEFLSWLAGWVALILREDWDEEKKRKLIANIFPLYRMRGTKESLKEYIRIYVGADVPITIYDFTEPFVVGETSTIGVDTVVGYGPPYYFVINVCLPIKEHHLRVKIEKGIREIIDREKPAHTYYHLITTIPSMRIAFESKVGVDTLLGGSIESNKTSLFFKEVKDGRSS